MLKEFFVPTVSLFFGFEYGKFFGRSWLCIFHSRMKEMFFMGHFILVHGFPVHMWRFFIKVRTNKKFISHLFVVPRRVVFREIVCQI